MQSLVAPVIALSVWTHVMWFWMYLTRLPAIQRVRMRLDPNAIRGEQMATLPAKARWKADNYNHLFEQPTVFYAVALSLAVLGDHSSTSLTLAWVYVGVRVVHSLWQSLFNIIQVRFVLFATSAILLMVLTARAAMLLP